MKEGICHICGKYTKLSFEHLPPEKANNNMGVKMIDIIDVINNNKMPWDLDGIHYNNVQQGFGKYTLCSECNSKTGSWYGQEYINISNSILNYINSTDLINANGYEFTIKKIYPLRFIKQVISMFLSSFDETTLSINKELQEFVLDKEKNKFDKTKYRISMYILKTPKFELSSRTHLYYESGLKKEIAMLDLFPLGFEMEFNPSGDSENTDITLFTESKYDEYCSMKMTIPARERVGLFPTDYRTKSEIIKAVSEEHK